MGVVHALHGDRKVPQSGRQGRLSQAPGGPRGQDDARRARALAVKESTAGYAQEAPALLELYESISVETLHQPVWHLIPTTPSTLIDIGAGTGRDAAHFAAMGHQVLAVE